MNKNNSDNTGEIIIFSDSQVPFQGVPLPFSITGNDQLKVFERAMAEGIPVNVVPLLNPILKPSESNTSSYGVAMKVMRIIDLPDGNKNVFLVGENRVKIEKAEYDGGMITMGKVKKSSDKLLSKDMPRFQMVMQLVEETYEYVKEYFSEMAKIQMAPPQELINDRRHYLNFIIVISPIDYTERVRLLETGSLLKRAEDLLVILNKVKLQIDLRKEIFTKASFNIEKEQRDNFLRAQIRTIQNEIGETDEEDFENLLKQSQNKKWPAATQAYFEKEVRKLRRFNPNSPDYAIQFNYLETLLSLPWEQYSETEIDIDKLQEDLNRDHFGLEKVKERITEHIAVLKLRGDMRSPILCLYGPPGVGKTSLCKSIADSIGRDYVRISLGGMHDETQIRGHRRTYIGALPGRIITGMQKSATNNPVFVLDEVDKIGSDHRGDPSQALLEVLDPEQNPNFYDNYLDTEYDLSKVLFIATANNISSISAPLLDRMELIEITGYTPEEKIEIAIRHLIPKNLVAHGFKADEVKFTEEALRKIIESYTRESGVRNLEKKISAIIRKLAVQKVRNDDHFPDVIDEAGVIKVLGSEDILVNLYEQPLPAGVTAGLAWTPVGGEILYFESSISKGKGLLTVTGNLGDVMKESATIALQWVKSNAEKLGIDSERFEKTDIHLHVPEGAVPKDGPSAGITMICSIAGILMDKKLKENVAMTGEATLSGKVLPVGGIKEKILAARRAGLTNIVISQKNKKDIDKMEERYTSGLNFIYVENIDEVIRYVFGER